MVLVELVWVLERLCAIDRDRTLLAVTSLLENDAFAFAFEDRDRDRVGRAIDPCKRKGHDFPDAMIALKNESMPCKSTTSFDKATRGLPAMRLLRSTAFDGPARHHRSWTIPQCAHEPPLFPKRPPLRRP